MPSISGIIDVFKFPSYRDLHIIFRVLFILYRIAFASALVYFMGNLLGVFFSQVMPHLLYGGREEEAPVKMEGKDAF